MHTQLYDEFVCTACDAENEGERCYLLRPCRIRKPVQAKGNSTLPRLTCENGKAQWEYVK
jgi:hypothetical protein